MLLFVCTTRYFKLGWNTTAPSQSNCRNFSCSSIRNPEYSSRNRKSHQLKIGIRNPSSWLTKNQESGTWKTESTAWNPEYNTDVLGSFAWGKKYQKRTRDIFWEWLCRGWQTEKNANRATKRKVTVSFSGLILIIGVIGNGVVAAVITTLRRRGHKNSVQLFLLHLAISDLMVCLLCIPLTIFTNFYYPQEYLKDREGLCKLSRFMQVRKDGGFTVTLCYQVTW